MTAPGYGVWAKCCYQCKAVEVCRSRDALVEASRKHKGHFTTLTGGPGVVTAGDLAAKLPTELRAVYWRTKLDEYFTDQSIKP